ncbi:MAG: hypothetical protein JWN43_2155 [Gammaproteobacteria bacterium]|nr:hypothetical protein [Gammaproteobacteria bacterium]
MALSLFAACAAGAAVIYKWTDADGVIHYSDQAVPGAEKIVTSSASANGVGGSARAVGTSTSNKAPPTGLDYDAFAIETPAKEQVFFGDEIVPVRLRLQPALKPSQTITWHLNGAQLQDQTPDSTAFALQALPRGTYVVAATLTDAVSGDSRSTDSVTFYVRQPSELSPQHKRP